MTIQYGKSEHGYEFPMYNGELLSWTLSATSADEREGYPKMRTVIRAMMESRPEQLATERHEMLKASFNSMFGRNASKVLAVIDEEISIARRIHEQLSQCGYCANPLDDGPYCSQCGGL